jgi:hypothetical protein
MKTTTTGVACIRTFDADALAAFYKACPRAGGDGEHNIRDHSPRRCWD